MIKIRYRGSNELSPGLHATAERHGRTTTVYLLAGLTVAQRRSALRRLRLTARMGHCPRLPAVQLGFALFTDRIRTGFGRTGAVLRLHPAGSTVPIMVLSGGVIAFLLFSTVSIHVLRTPRTASKSPVASAMAIGGGSQGEATGQGGPKNQPNPGDPRGSRDPADPGGPNRGSQARQLTQPSRGSATTPPALAAGGGSGGGSGSDAKNGSGKGSGGGTTLSGAATPTPSAPQQTAPDTTVPAPDATAPAPDATAPATAPAWPGSSSSSPPDGACVDVGPLGVCLDT